MGHIRTMGRSYLQLEPSMFVILATDSDWRGTNLHRGTGNESVPILPNSLSRSSLVCFIFVSSRAGFGNKNITHRNTSLGIQLISLLPVCVSNALCVQALPVCPIQASCDAASKEENKDKNRYVNILPCESSTWR